MKRRVAMAAFALLLVSLLTACGNRMSTENVVTPIPAATATTMPRVTAVPSAAAKPTATSNPTAENGVVTDENGVIGDETGPNGEQENGTTNNNSLLQDAEEGLDRAEDKAENGLNDAAGVVR